MKPADAAFLEERRKLYEKGHTNELLYCLTWCLQNGASIRATWVYQAFLEAYFAVSSQEKTWDEVFGDPRPKTKKGKGRVHRETARRDIKINYPIWAAVQKLHAKGQPIDQAMFEKIAKMFDPEIKFGTIRDIYYQSKDGIENSLGFEKGIVPKEFAKTLKVQIDEEYSRAVKAFLKRFQKD